MCIDGIDRLGRKSSHCLHFVSLHVPHSSQDQPIWRYLRRSVTKRSDGAPWARKFYVRNLHGDKENPTNLEILELANEKWKPYIEAKFIRILKQCPHIILKTEGWRLSQNKNILCYDNQFVHFNVRCNITVGYSIQYTLTMSHLSQKQLT